MSEHVVTAPLCDMWLGHCGRPARLVIETTVPIGSHDQPLSWWCCDQLACMKFANDHAEAFGLEHVDTRLITAADVVAHSVQMGAAA